MKETNHPESPVTVGLVSLGCAKNLVDAEVMLGSLLEQGMNLTNTPEEADVVIINTCSFIDAAQEESVDTILETAEFREHTRPDQGLIVSGCLPQRFRKQLPELLPEVDAFMGVDQITDAPRIVREALKKRAVRNERKKSELIDLGTLAADEKQGKSRRQSIADTLEKENAAPDPAPVDVAPMLEVTARPVYIPDYATPRFRLTPQHFTYVKIAEGCNHPCSFCIIPRMRGSHRSRPQTDVVKDCEQRVKSGTLELNLISQDTTFYGLDLQTAQLKKGAGSIAAPDKFSSAAHALGKDATTLTTLLRELNGLEGDFWIRLLYTHPAHWTDELMEAIASLEKVVKYVDMPLQHIHDVMLERMRRETNQDYIVQLIRRIRKNIPGIHLRTTFIVGFPGETEEYFQRLLDFMEEVRFERLGIFTYSKEDGTRAGSMASQIPEEVRQERKQRAMEVQRRISREINQSKIGSVQRALIEGPATDEALRDADIQSWEHGLIRMDDSESGSRQEVESQPEQFFVARGEGDAPDIDGRIYVRGNPNVGSFQMVKITGATDYDLIAEPLSN